MAPAGGGSTERTSERHERALKVDPRLAAGEPVRVARAQNGAEAELLQALLLEVGVPSMLRRSAGFDVPDLMAAGPRDVLVPAAAEQTAREILDAGAVERTVVWPRVAPTRLLAGLLLALALGALVIWGIWVAVH
ncbi:MAG: hypothetical protein ACRDMJ_07175 [Solirubrobacteraceae bacterium]